MAINLSGQAIQDVRVAGVQAQRVMLGTGSTAVEVWSASIYPLTGTWTDTFGLGDGHIFRHTIAESGTYTLTHSLTGHNGVWGRVYIETPNGDASANAYPEGVASLTVALSPGDEVWFSAWNEDWGVHTYTGSWSITKI